MKLRDCYKRGDFKQLNDVKEKFLDEVKQWGVQTALWRSKLMARTVLRQGADIVIVGPGHSTHLQSLIREKTGVNVPVEIIPAGYGDYRWKRRSESEEKVDRDHLISAVKQRLEDLQTAVDAIDNCVTCVT